MSVIPTNKLLLEESNHIIEIKLLALGFLQILVLISNFQEKTIVCLPHNTSAGRLWEDGAETGGNFQQVR